MSNILKLVVCCVALILSQRVHCVKLTRKNIVALADKFDPGSFSSKNISEIDPAALGLINGSFLQLPHNKLEYLQGALFKDNSLFEYLSFESNRIIKIHPRVFRALEKLSDLNLSGNRLEDMDEALFEGNAMLRRLNLNDNKIRFFHANTFRNLKNLEVLSVSSNQLTSFSLNLVFSLLILTELHLNQNNLTEINYQNLKLNLPKLYLVSLSNNFNCSYAEKVDDYLRNNNVMVTTPSTDSCITDDQHRVVRRRDLEALIERILTKKFNKSHTNLDIQLKSVQEKFIVRIESMEKLIKEQNLIIHELKSHLMKNNSLF